MPAAAGKSLSQAVVGENSRIDDAAPSTNGGGDLLCGRLRRVGDGLLNVNLAAAAAARASPVSCTVSDTLRMDTAVTTNDEHENSRRRATVRRLRLSPTFSSLTGKWIHPLAGVLALVTRQVKP